jgi:plasmid stabilization system protein ParE
MAYDVIILPGAETDIDEAIRWYESQQKGLGVKFYSFLLDKLEDLKFNAQYYFNLDDGFRRITTDPFPFNIIYKIFVTKVVIYAVFHQSREIDKLLRERK